MRTIISLTIIAATCLLFSCTKNIQSANKLLTGQWKVVTDTTTAGFAQANHFVVYTGKAGDYFNFESNNKLYINENGNAEVLSYNIISNSVVVINSFYSTGENDTCHIYNLTNNNVVISKNFLYTPGGTFGRSVHLVK